MDQTSTTSKAIETLGKRAADFNRDHNNRLAQAASKRLGVVHAVTSEIGYGYCQGQLGETETEFCGQTCQVVATFQNGQPIPSLASSGRGPVNEENRGEGVASDLSTEHRAPSTEEVVPSDPSAKRLAPSASDRCTRINTPRAARQLAVQLKAARYFGVAVQGGWHRLGGQYRATGAYMIAGQEFTPRGTDRFQAQFGHTPAEAVAKLLKWARIDPAEKTRYKVTLLDPLPRGGRACEETNRGEGASALPTPSGRFWA